MRMDELAARLGAAQLTGDGSVAITAGYASVLLDHWRETTDDDKREAIERIGKQASRMARLVEDLLATSRIDSGELVVRSRPLDLIQVVEDVLEDFKKEPVRLEPKSASLVMADRDHVEQMLVNYLSNALKYGTPPVTVAVSQRDGAGVVAVRDRGEGVPRDFVPHLFRRFARGPSPAERHISGTGLGLSIVPELAQAQGGDAWYEPNQPQGGCFCFSLPLAELG